MPQNQVQLMFNAVGLVVNGQTAGDILFFNGATGNWERTNILNIDNVNSRVGIGKTPGYTLDVAGYITAQNFKFGGGTGSIYTDVNWGCLIRCAVPGGVAAFAIHNSVDTSLLYITNSCDMTMEASGGGYYSHTDHQWHNGSSRRFKENIQTLTSGLDLLNLLKPVKFDWKTFDPIKKDDKGKILSGTDTWKSGGIKNRLGFIAEDVMEILPNCATMSQQDSEYADGYDLTAIVAILVKSVQELNAKVEALSGSKI